MEVKRNIQNSYKCENVVGVYSIMHFVYIFPVNCYILCRKKNL